MLKVVYKFPTESQLRTLFWFNVGYHLLFCYGRNRIFDVHLKVINVDKQIIVKRTVRNTNDKSY